MPNQVPSYLQDLIPGGSTRSVQPPPHRKPPTTVPSYLQDLVPQSSVTMPEKPTSSFADRWDQGIATVKQKGQELLRKTKAAAVALQQHIEEQERQRWGKTRREIYRAGGMPGPLGMPITAEQLAQQRTPLVDLATPVKRRLQASPFAQQHPTLSGVTESVAETVSALTSPENLSYMAMGGVPGVGRAVAAAFAPQLVHQAVTAAHQGAVTDDPREKAKAYTTAVLTGGLGTAAGKHAVSKMTVPPGVRQAAQGVRTTLRTAAFPRLAEVEAGGSLPVPLLPQKPLISMRPASVTRGSQQAQRPGYVEPITLTKPQRDTLEQLREEIRTATAGSRSFIYDDTPGIGGDATKVVEVPSTFPIQHLGAKQQQLQIIDKVLRGQPLTEKQSALYTAIDEHINRQLGEIDVLERTTPQEMVTGDLQLRKGDKVQVENEWLQVKKSTPETLLLKDGKTVRLDPMFDRLPVQGGEKFGVQRKGTPPPPSAVASVVPETPQTIALQLDALQQKRVPTVLIPEGPVPIPPRGIKTVETPVGTWLYDPLKTSAQRIQAKVADNTYHELLGHLRPKGPETIAVVRATQEGTEAKTSAARPDEVPVQAAQLQRQFPQAEITAGGPELAAEILAHRQAGRSSVSRGDLLTTARIPMTLARAEPASAPQTTVGASHIMQTIRAAFPEVPIRVGHFRRRVKGAERLGIFKPREEVVRLQAEGDLATAMHEVAHAIDRTLMGGLRGKESQWLKPWADELRKLDYAPEKGRLFEGFAEYVRHWATGTGDAVAKAPKFTHFFEQELFAQRPELAQKLTTIRDQITQWRQQGAEARVLGQIDFSGHRPLKPVKELVRRVARRAETLFIDQLAPLKYAVQEGTKGATLAPSKNPYDLAIAAQKTADAKARMFVLDGTFDFTLNKTGPGLKEILAPVADRIEPFLAYAYARRAVDLHTRNINPGISRADAEFVANKYASDPAFTRAAEALQYWNDALLTYVIDAGALSPEAAVAMRQANPFYIPLKRVFVDDVRRSGTGKGYVDLPAPTKRIKGSGRQIQHPIDALIQQSAQLIGLADRARVAHALADLSHQYEGMGRWVEKVDTPMEVHKVPLKQLEDALAMVDFMQLANVQHPQMAAKVLDEILTVYSNAPRYYGKDNIVAVYRNGKRQFYELDPALYAAMKGMDKATLPWLVNLIFGVPSRAVRLGATGLRAGFQLVTNPIRDVWTAVVQSQSPGPQAALRSFVGLKHVLTRSETYKRWQRAGGEMAQPLGLDRQALHQVRQEVLANTATRKAMNIVSHPIEALKAVLSLSEAMSRVGEFARVESQLGRGTPDAAVAAATAAADVTVNFRRMGAYGNLLNTLVAFWNPAIQGLSKFSRTVRGPQAKRAATAALSTITAPMLALWYLHKDEPWYQELPLWEKLLFMHFKIGDEVVRLPLPFEWGYTFGAVPIAIADSLYRQDPTIFTESTAEILTNMVPDVIPTAARPLMEVSANKDYFRKRPIESRRLQGLLPEARYQEHTAPAFVQAGKALGVSPLKLEHLAAGYSGGLGTDLVNLSQYQKPAAAREAADIPVIGRLFSRQGRMGQSVERVYDELERLEQVYQTLKQLDRTGDRATFAELQQREGFDFERLQLLRHAAEAIHDYAKQHRSDFATKVARQALGLEPMP